MFFLSQTCLEPYGLIFSPQVFFGLKLVSTPWADLSPQVFFVSTYGGFGKRKFAPWDRGQGNPVGGKEKINKI